MRDLSLLLRLVLRLLGALSRQIVRKARWQAIGERLTVTPVQGSINVWVILMVLEVWQYGIRLGVGSMFLLPGSIPATPRVHFIQLGDEP